MKEEKIEEFDFDTWLENQPEGTFVQGGGIDEETPKNQQKGDRLSKNRSIKQRG